jgi:hypothetical protein
VKSALHQALAAYLGAASEFTGVFTCLCASTQMNLDFCAEPEIRLVLSPETSQREDRTSRYAGIPSVVDAIHALEEVGRRLSGTFIRLAELSAELSSDPRARDDLVCTLYSYPKYQYTDIRPVALSTASIGSRARRPAADGPR